MSTKICCTDIENLSLSNRCKSSAPEVDKGDERSLAGYSSGSDPFLTVDMQPAKTDTSIRKPGCGDRSAFIRQWAYRICFTSVALTSGTGAASVYLRHSGLPSFDVGLFSFRRFELGWRLVQGRFQPCNRLERNEPPRSSVHSVIGLTEQFLFSLVESPIFPFVNGNHVASCPGDAVCG